MIRSAKFALLVVSASVLASVPAAAQSASKERKPADPNEVVCEKQTVVGSRLATKRICQTRAQWAEQRRLDRQDLDKAQQSRSLRAD